MGGADIDLKRRRTGRRRRADHRAVTHGRLGHLRAGGSPGGDLRHRDHGRRRSSSDAASACCAASSSRSCAATPTSPRATAAAAPSPRTCWRSGPPRGPSRPRPECSRPTTTPNALYADRSSRASCRSAASPKNARSASPAALCAHHLPPATPQPARLPHRPARRPRPRPPSAPTDLINQQATERSKSVLIARCSSWGPGGRRFEILSPRLSDNSRTWRLSPARKDVVQIPDRCAGRTELSCRRRGHRRFDARLSAVLFRLRVGGVDSFGGPLTCERRRAS